LGSELHWEGTYPTCGTITILKVEMERIILTLMLLGLILVFTIGTIQKRRKF